LLKTEFNDAERGSWLDPSRLGKLDDVESSIFHSMKLAYQGGKGNDHLVPVLIPDDTWDALRLLGDSSVREMCEVTKNNIYMFPCTQGSSSHISGWHAIHRICMDAELKYPERITATKMRHRVSTLYAALDVSEQDRQLFYKHMGHSAAINMNIYQAPLAESEMVIVGGHLSVMDGVCKKRKVSSKVTSAENVLCDELPQDKVPCDEIPQVCDLAEDVPENPTIPDICEGSSSKEDDVVIKKRKTNGMIFERYFFPLFLMNYCASVYLLICCCTGDILSIFFMNSCLLLYTY